MDTLSLGIWGEAFAARYLETRGLRVIDRHYRQKWGEIDLICKDASTWVFVEVKTRSKAWQPSALDAIGYTKRMRLASAAMSYMKWKRLEGQSMRFDVVTIEDSEVQWIQDAFPNPTHFTY